jgi:hypothetical protein
MQLGDARSGKLPENIVAFGRMLRRAGVTTDSSRMALAVDAVCRLGLERKDDLAAALEAVLISREQDRSVFRELFDAFFRDPEIANQLLAQLLPSSDGKAEPDKKRARVRDALQPPKNQPNPAGNPDSTVELDAAMTASDHERLNLADFNTLAASEYHLVERLAKEIALPIPEVASRRYRRGLRGHRIHWQRALHQAAQLDGELIYLPRLSARLKPLPLLILIDISGSMERYARLLMAFLHSATRHNPKRHVFAFGTHLTDLTSSFQMADADDMLLDVARKIPDFAGGTRLGLSLSELKKNHANCLVGRRTVVVVITDGLDTGEPSQLARQLDWIKRHSRLLLWLNPLLRFDAYEPIARGAALLHQKADAMLAVHNLSKLESLAQALQQLLRK